MIFGFFAYTNAINHLENHAIATDANYLELGDILVASFLHHDFEQFDYLWRNDSSILLAPIVFYLIGSLIGAHSFLRKNKGYHYFIYARCQNNANLAPRLLGKIWIPLFFYQLFYWIGIFIGMLIFESEFIEPVLSMSMMDLVAFFTIRLLMLAFLVFATFIVFIKREAAIAILANILMIVLMLLISNHIRFVNLAFLADLNSMIGSILLWIPINLLMYVIIKFGVRYELS